ncbi:GldG family protein [Natronospira bacteriovora]|uniref:Gldg family protein n=1 Tax=Natronospira bacteriovora TaxID=3069753 RepID=A0ABU0W8Y6_9GAMM|nr:Gldg family protein [Natronospira sp. AB-CW4]MDQ2070492.1 Gldg family protein [Natronospira sp. AB-CW4]
MKMDRRTQWQNRLQRWLTVMLLLAIVGALAVASQRFATTFDWTHGARGSLSEASRHLLQEIDEPLEFIVFLGDQEELRSRVRTAVDRYQAIKPAIQLTFINPDLEPQRSREFGVTQMGEIFVRVGEQRQRVERFTEAGITNALARAARAEDRFVVFTRGHGEPDPLGQANHDLGQLGEQLRERGLRLQRSNIAERGIPDNTAAVVIAGNRTGWLPGEIDRLKAYLEDGGNLIWLIDPHGQPPGGLADHLGLGLPEATVKDPTGQMLGIDDPGLVLIFQYEENPVTGPLDAVTLFPHVTMVDAAGMDDWTRQPILRTSGEAWLEDHDRERLAGGPFHLGLLMTRTLEVGEGIEQEQRIAVIGSTAFLSNAFIGNGVNLELGTRLFNWASADPLSLAVPVRSAPDRELDLGRTGYTVIGSFFLLILPGLFLATGVFFWWWRRR